MTNFDDQLRATLDAAAREVPEESLARVRRHPYRAARRSRVARLSIGSTAVVGAGTAIAVVLSIGTAAPNAFASWSPTPTHASAHEVADASATCLADVTAQGEQLNTQVSNVAFPTDASGWASQVTDVRGPFSLIYYTGTTNGFSDAGLCLDGGASWSAGPEISVQSHQGGDPGSTLGVTGYANASGGNQTYRSWQGGSFSSLPTPPAADSVTGPTFSGSGNGPSYAIGLAGADVTGVVLTLSDGTTVTASVDNGYYAAWWPSGARVTGATVTTATGTSTVVFSNANSNHAVHNAGS